jgi:O-antigen/teichoic acid export membrane protein
MGLKSKAVSGFIWTISQQFSVQVINFAVQIVLARLLLPEAFGLIAMLQLFIAVGQILIDNGMASSLIRTQNPDQGDYSTVFIINIAVSIAVYFVLFFAAPYIAIFYHIPLLKAVLRVFILSFLIQALVGVQTTRLTKIMNFKLQMLMQIPSVVIGGAVGLILAFKHFGVWSLVYMNLTRSFVFMIQHWFYTDWRPAFIIDKEKLKYHFGFGYKLTLSGLLDVIYNNSYNIIIGKFFSATLLGYYNQADTLRMFPVNNVSTALNKITYPMFSSIQNEDIKLKMVYRKLMQQVFFWIIPIMLSLIIIAVPLFKFTIGAKWLPAVPYFQILCVSAIMYPFHIYNLNIINVKGRSDLFLRLEVIKKGLGILVIICAIFFGIYGLLFSQIVLSFGGVYINTFYSGKMINYHLSEQLKDVWPMFALGIATAILVYYANALLLMPRGFPNFAAILIIGFGYFTVYIGASWFLKVTAIEDFVQLILKKG